MGQFRAASTYAVPAGQNVVSVIKTGYVTQRVSFGCCGPEEIALDITMRRVVSVTLSGPASLM